MSLERVIVYTVGALLILFGLRRRSNRLRARNIAGNVVVGDVSGAVNQSYQGGAAPPAQSEKPDRIAWAIGSLGVLIAVAQLAHDVFWGK